MYRNIFKRLIDVVLSFIGIIVVSPIYLLMAIFIRLESEGPVIFKQKRLGVNGVPFNIYKFRSMYINSEKKGSGVYSGKDDPRVTKVGKFIRLTSIDELPQFVNILKGDMAIIGPRPALTYHPWSYEEYTEEQKKMFSVRPGVTGWAQIHGRKDVEWNKRIEMNVWYAEHLNFWLDVKIFFATIFKVITFKDNYNVEETAAKTDSAMKG